MKYEFSTKLNSRKNSAGVTVEKVRVWLEESKNNRFLSDAGFIRGAAVDITINWKKEILDPNGPDRINIRLLPPEELPAGKRTKVAGKADRSLFDITRNSDQMPAAFHPKNNARLVANVERGFITITAK